MENFARYHRAIAYIEGLLNLPMEKDYMKDRSHPSMYLKRMEYFLGLLNNPEVGMKYIHVTGTAGKGTVTTMIHEMLHAAGERVGSFTSPFVTTSIEKIRVGDLYIAPDEFADIVEEMKPAIDEAYFNGSAGRPSYFEIFLGIALLYFQKQQCTWVVMEVGVGGRYDATNFMKHSVVSVITNIDYDHMALLGKTLKKIALDKAGIIKPDGMLITSEQRPQLLKMFQALCNEQGSAFYRVPRKNSFREYNESLALLVAEKVGIPEDAARRGIARTHLQCRFEIIQKNPLVVLDGAHNRIKMQSTMENLGKLTFEKLHLVIGMADNKDHLSMLDQIVPLADAAYFTRFRIGERQCASPRMLREKAKAFLKPDASVSAFLDPMRALQHALKNAGPNDCVLVTGSFFLAGDLRQHWISEETILQNRRSR